MTDKRKRATEATPARTMPKEAVTLIEPPLAAEADAASTMDAVDPTEAKPAATRRLAPATPKRPDVAAVKSVILGSVDQFEGLYVTGWAIALPDDHICIIELRDVDDKVVGKGRAGRSRADLAGLGYGRTSFAFRVAVKDVDTAQLLRVMADGKELSGSPITVGAGIFDGYLAAQHGVVDGWVTERHGNFTGALVEIVDQNDIVLASAQATAEPFEGDPFFAPARFHFVLPPHCFGRPELQLRARANGVPFAAPLTAPLRLVGFIDALRPDRVAGWLLSPDSPHQRFELEVLRDGEKVGAGHCGLPRTDLQAAYPNSWEVGFDIPLTPPPDGVIAASRLSIRLPGSQAELFDGPFVVSHRAGLIEATRRVTALAHATPGLTELERTVLQTALSEYIGSRRHNDDYVALKQIHRPPRFASTRRMNVVIPIYRNAAVTKACIDSVLRHRTGPQDAIVLVNDASPDSDMLETLRSFLGTPELYLLNNDRNLGFVQSVNRALDFCQTGDVVLLNSDTVVFAGGLDELWHAAHSAPEIGTATALSNNATIFTYPDPQQPETELADISWESLAAGALAQNAGQVIDVPTGHGFCMLIKRETLDRVGRFNEAFGRGYGEENEFCMRAADLGWRNVAAAGVFVEHRERTSFGAERDALLRSNVPMLESMFPEYTPTIMAFERRDELRRARLGLHGLRLGKLRAEGRNLVLVIDNQLGGGTAKAKADIESEVGYGDAVRLRLSCTMQGMIALEAETPPLRDSYRPEDLPQVFAMLAGIGVDLVVVHQLLGFTADAIAAIGAFAKARRSVYYLHDFYAICPRVTMIDALGEFCNRADVDRCAICVGIGGGHEHSRLGALAPVEHRGLMGDVLAGMAHVLAPSADAAGQLTGVFPDLKPEAIPHPHVGLAYPAAARKGSNTDILLLGAVGPHKGSARLLEVAKRARLTHPKLHFHVIGFTDIDDELKATGNITVTGEYQPAALGKLIDAAKGRLALFLHGWPETFSYTLSEAVEHGLIPLVPDIGAPAERVRAAGFGAVFPFPFSAAQVLDVIAGIADGRIATQTAEGSPTRYETPDSVARIAAVFGVAARTKEPASKEPTPA